MPYFPPEITKEFILAHVSEEEIFSFYGIPVTSCPFRSPLPWRYKPDRSASCSFYRGRTSGRLYLKDWGGYFNGDCFDLAMKMEGISYHEALRHLANQFGLIKEGNISPVRSPLPPVIPWQKEAKDIRVRRRPWVSADWNYWRRWDFSKDTLEFYDVSPAERIWIDGNSIYLYNAADPAYIYHFTGYQYKIYFPLRDKASGKPRFINNCAEVLQGYRQLPARGRFCLITKSNKDVMKLHEFDIPAVAKMSESQILTKEEYDELTSRFDYLFSLYDTDYTGVRSMQQMKRLYNIRPLFFPRSLPTKDFTDFYEHFGIKNTNVLIESTKTILS